MNYELDQTGYIVSGNNIEETTYRDYLVDYGADETTTRRGVAPRLHVRKVELDVYKKPGSDVLIDDEEYEALSEEDQSECTYYGTLPNNWQIWSWGVGGNHPYYTGMEFDNEEDADLFLYEAMEEHIHNHDNIPVFASDRGEAVEQLAERLGKPADVVERYLSIKAISEEKKTERQARALREREEREAKLAVEVPAEAASITIDDQFKADIATAVQASGLEKSNRIVGAVKGLLQRNNKEKIESDFWQVARILKAKAV